MKCAPPTSMCKRIETSFFNSTVWEILILDMKLKGSLALPWEVENLKSFKTFRGCAQPNLLYGFQVRNLPFNLFYPAK